MRQEPDAVDRVNVGAGALLAAISIVVALGVTALFLRAAPAAPHVAGPPPSSTVETSLILATERGLTLRAEQRAKLDRSGWIDRDAGIAQIPIERAMDIIADGGRAP